MTAAQYLAKALDEVCRLEQELGEGDIEHELGVQLHEARENNRLPKRAVHDDMVGKLRRIATLAGRAADFYEACPCK